MGEILATMAVINMDPRQTDIERSDSVFNGVQKNSYSEEEEK